MIFSSPQDEKDIPLNQPEGLEEEDLAKTMMDIEVDKNEQPVPSVLKKGLPAETEKDESERPVEELLRREKSLLTRIGLGGLFHKKKS